MKGTVKIGTVLLALALTMGTVHAQKFGYLNSSAILAELPEVKAANAELQALQTQLQKKGQGMAEKLQTDYAAVQQKVERGELSPKQQEEESKKLQDQETALNDFQQEMRETMSKKQEALLTPIYDRVNKVISDVAKEEGLQFVFDQGVLLYSDPALDISEKVKAKLTANN